MKAHEIIKKEIENRGVKQNYVADGIGMPSELLGRSLKGKRALKADEFVRICLFLSLDLSDFKSEIEKKERQCTYTRQ